VARSAVLSLARKDACYSALTKFAMVYSRGFQTVGLPPGGRCYSSGGRDLFV
jgi:hypothetical protein